MESRNRITYVSQEVFVGSPPNETSKNITGFSGAGYVNVLQRLNQIQSFNYSFDMPKASPQVLGRTAPLNTRVAEAPPSVQVNFSYYLDGITNNYRLGLTSQNQKQIGTIPFLSGVMHQTGSHAPHIYLVSARTGIEIGSRLGSYADIEPVRGICDGGTIPIDQVIDPQSPHYDTFIFQNCYLNNYSLNFGIGELATVEVGMIGNNAMFYNSGSGIQIPDINPRDGGRVARTMGDEPCFFAIPKKFGNDNGETMSTVQNVFASSDITLDIHQRIKTPHPNTHDPHIGIDTYASGMDWIIDKGSIQSCQISFNLEREHLPYVGYKLYPDRPLKLPVSATVSFELIASGNPAGNFFSGFQIDNFYDLNIDMFGTAYTLESDDIDPVVKNIIREDDALVTNYQVSGARLLSIDNTSSIGADKITSLSFGVEIDLDDINGGRKQSRGFYESGNLMEIQWGFLIYDLAGSTSSHGYLEIGTGESQKWVAETRETSLFPVY